MVLINANPVERDRQTRNTKRHVRLHSPATGEFLHMGAASLTTDETFAWLGTRGQVAKLRAADRRKRKANRLLEGFVIVEREG